MKNDNFKSHSGGGLFVGSHWRVLFLAMALFLLPDSGARAQAVPDGARYQAGQLEHKGRARGARPGNRINIFNASTGEPVYSTVAGNRGAFHYKIDIPEVAAPCSLEVHSGKARQTVPVNPRPSYCNNEQAAVCSVRANRSALKLGRRGANFNFAAQIDPNAPVTRAEWILDKWDLSGETPSPEKQEATVRRGRSSVRANYTQPGRYAASFSAYSGEKLLCKKTVVVSVEPNLRGIPKKVDEQAAPPVASGMSGEYVVLPFTEKTDVGVGQSSAPYNPYLQTQGLKALVYEKDPKQPKAVTNGVDITYSAGSNRNDPAGRNSINSTSQNWFSDATAGANYNSANPDAYSRENIANKTTLLDGKRYEGGQTDGVKKTGVYDRKLARNSSGGSDMTRLTSNPATLMTRLDEGARADHDEFGPADGGTRKMPGTLGAYSRNDEQSIAVVKDDFFSAQMLPIIGVDDLGRQNPFPLMRVAAKKDGQRVSSTDIVVASSSEMTCAACHTKGQIAANDEVWRQPVTITDPEARGDACGDGENLASCYTGPKGKIWAPAVQNRFELRIVENVGGKNRYQMANPFNANAANLRENDGVFDQDEAFQPIFVKNQDGSDFISDVTGQPMILRGDRIKAYRIVDGKLQIQLRFYAPENDSKQARDKAALFNNAILHDYYDSFGPSNPAGYDPENELAVPRNFVTQFADVADDKTLNVSANPASCGGHHFSNSNHNVGRGALYDARFVYSNYSRTMHSFHGRLQVYERDVSVQESSDGLAHSKGELIRDKHGHHIAFGGAGWDPERKDDVKVDRAGMYDGTRNNWDPDAVPMHALGELLLPFDVNGKKADITENCSICHAGKTETVYNDMHYSTGLKCESCHGDMLAVGGMYLRPGKNFTDKHAFRVFEYDQPDCGSCHNGDGDAKFDGRDPQRLAFDKTDKSMTTLPVQEDTIDMRFSVLPSVGTVFRPATARTPASNDKLCFGTDDCNDKLATAETVLSPPPVGDPNGLQTEYTAQPLFRKSRDSHGDVPCQVCHGPSHNIWPIANSNDNNNMTSKQLQGYDGTILECDVCHSKDGQENSFADGMLASDEAVAYGKRGVLVRADDQRGYLAGPHGMHPINDPNWFSDAPQDPNQTPGGWHSVSAKIPGPNGEDQCAACHGKDHESANRLAKTQIARVYRRMIVEGKRTTVKVAAGQPVNCTDCHSKAISFRETPWENESFAR